MTFRRLVLGLAFAAAPLGARPLGAQSPDTFGRWVDSIFAGFASKNAPGCAVGVMRDGHLILARGYGSADLEHGVPITPETRFYLASLSKQFTAMSVVLLAQQRALSLDDSIQRWVPEVPAFGSTITLRDLLHHTSGIRDYFTLLGVSGWPSDGQLTEQAFLSLIGRQRSLNFQPGSEFLYSNTGYALLAIVVRRASGLSLRDYAAKNIFAPLGMTHTEFRDDHTHLVPDRAVGYEPGSDGFRVSQPEMDVVGDGGVYSTVDDMAKWDENFLTKRVGGAQGVALLEQATVLKNGEKVPYGMGLSLSQFRGEPTMVHDGSYAGYRASYLRIVDRKLSVITLCNSAGAPLTLAEQVGSVVVGVGEKKAAPPPSPLDQSAALWMSGTGASTVDSIAIRRRVDQFAHTAGSYYSDELDLAVTLVARDGALVLQRPRGADMRFGLLTDDLFVTNDKILLNVIHDPQGTVSGFALTVGRARDIQFVRRDRVSTPDPH